MIPFPFNFFQSEIEFSPIDDIAPDLLLWLNPNSVADIGGDGTADRINNQATVPVSPQPAINQGVNAALIVEDGYNFDADSLLFAQIANPYYTITTYPEIQIDYTNGFSFAFWSKFSSLDKMQVFDSVDNSRNALTGINVFFQDGALYYGIEDIVAQGFSIRVGLNGEFNDDSWHFYYIKYEGEENANNFTVFVDGLNYSYEIVSNTTPNTATINQIDPYIAKGISNSDYFYGELGHVYIFDTGITNDEIQILNNYYTIP